MKTTIKQSNITDIVMSTATNTVSTILVQLPIAEVSSFGDIRTYGNNQGDNNASWKAMIAQKAAKKDHGYYAVGMSDLKFNSIDTDIELELVSNQGRLQTAGHSINKSNNRTAGTISNSFDIIMQGAKQKGINLDAIQTYMAVAKDELDYRRANRGTSNSRPNTSISTPTAIREGQRMGDLDIHE